MSTSMGEKVIDDGIKNIVPIDEAQINYQGIHSIEEWIIIHLMNSCTMMKEKMLKVAFIKS